MSTPPDFFAHDYEPQPEPDADDERRQAVPPPPDGQRRQAPPPPAEASTTATGRAAPATPPPPDEQRRQAPQAPPPPAGPPAQHYPQPPSHPIIARPPYPQGQPGAPVPAWQPTPDSRADFSHPIPMPSSRNSRPLRSMARIRRRPIGRRPPRPTSRQPLALSHCSGDLSPALRRRCSPPAAAMAPTNRMRLWCPIAGVPPARAGARRFPK